MPEDILEFKSELRLSLKADGIENVAAGVKDITKNLKRQGKTAKDLVGDYGSLAAAAKKLSKNYKDANKTLDNTNKKLAKLRRTAKTLAAPLNEAGSAMKKLVLPASFGSALRTVHEYNKSMLTLSASVNRLGIGFTSMEDNLTRIGRETSLTRVETNKLFADFEAGMRTISMGDFEGIMKRVRGIVGSSADAMGKMSSSIAELSQSYPSLSRSLTDLAISGKTMSSTEKGLLQARVRNLYMIGKISDAQYKQVTAYVKGNQQIGKWDSKRKKDIDEQTRAVQEFKRGWENVSHAVMTGLLPMLPKIANFIKGAFEWTEKWLGSTKKLGFAIIGLMAAMSGLKLAGGMMMGKMIGGGVSRGLGGGMGRKGGMGGVGGIASSLKPTNVFVVGMGPGVMAKFGILRGGAAKTAASSATGSAIGTAGGAAGGAAATTLMFKFGFAVGKIGLAIKATLVAALKFGAWMASLPVLLGAAAIAGLAVLTVKTREYSDTVNKVWDEQNMTQRDISERIAAPGKGASFDKRVTEAKSSKRYAASRQFQHTWKRKQDRILATVKDPVEMEKQLAALGVEREKARAKHKAKVAGGVYGESERSKKAKKEIARKVDVDKLKTEAIKSARGGNIASSYSSAVTAAQKAREAYDKIAGDEAVSTSYRGRRKSLGESKVKISEKQAEFDKKSPKMDTEQREAGQKRLDNMQAAYDLTEKKLRLDEESDDALQDSLSTLQKTQVVAEELVTISQKQKDIAEGIAGLASSQISVMDAMIEKQALMGQINEKEIQGSLKEGLGLLNAKKVALQAALDIISSELPVADKLTELEKKRSEESRAVYAGLKEANLLNEDSVDIATAQKTLQAQILGIVKEQSDAMNSVTKMYDQQLAKTSLLADRAGLMVQLADNYAIGVGASAQMRVDAYRAQEKEIGVLEQQLSKQQEMAAMDGASEAVKNKVYEIENKILGKQMAQAQQVRALRDGWVSAIGAMNAGAGGFADIVMTQTKGLALSQKMAGAVKAQILGRRGEGYSTSESFTRQMGVIKGNKGFRGAFGDDDDLRFLEKRESEKLMREMRRKGRNISYGAPNALGVSGHRMNVGRELQGQNPRYSVPTPVGGMSYGGGTPTINNTWNISGRVDEILKEVRKGLDEITYRSQIA